MGAGLAASPSAPQTGRDRHNPRALSPRRAGGAVLPASPGVGGV